MATCADCIDDLLGSGRVRVSPLPLADDGRSAEALQRLIASAEAACPGRPPAADPRLVRQALGTLHQACQMLVLRDLEPGPVGRLDGAGPSAHWSVDIALRHLPALYRLASERSRDDPLLGWIREAVSPWPLSSVGIPLEPLPDPAPVLVHPALALAYRDRCLAAGDAARCSQIAVRPLLAAAIGGHPGLLAIPISTAVEPIA